MISMALNIYSEEVQRLPHQGMGHSLVLPPVVAPSHEQGHSRVALTHRPEAARSNSQLAQAQEAVLGSCLAIHRIYLRLS